LNAVNDMLHPYAALLHHFLRDRLNDFFHVSFCKADFVIEIPDLSWYYDDINLGRI
jgi:hypothetical protein